MAADRVERPTHSSLRRSGVSTSMLTYPVVSSPMAPVDVHFLAQLLAGTPSPPAGSLQMALILLA
jgi:hypothetical protein